MEPLMRRPSRLFILKATAAAIVWWSMTVLLERFLVSQLNSVVAGSLLALIVGVIGAIWYVSEVRGCLAVSYGASDPGSLRDWRWLARQIPKLPGYFWKVPELFRRRDSGEP